jgi:hypothetical protein
MKNITISVDDETYVAARVAAAERGTSVSAMVKKFLQEQGNSRRTEGVREMPMTWTAPPATPAANEPPLPPGAYGRFADGTPYYTKDGKPRKPGAMRHLYSGGVDADLDGWPDGFIDAMYGEDTEAANNWWKPFAKPPAKPARKA